MTGFAQAIHQKMMNSVYEKIYGKSNFDIPDYKEKSALDGWTIVDYPSKTDAIQPSPIENSSEIEHLLKDPKNNPFLTNYSIQTRMAISNALKSSTKN